MAHQLNPYFRTLLNQSQVAVAAILPPFEIFFSFEGIPKGISSLFLEALDHMGVCVNGGRDALMAKEFLNHFSLDALREENSGKSMPEVMEPEVWETGLFSNSLELMGNGRRI